MLPVTWALLVGVVVGILARQGTRRPFARTMSLTLVGSFAGTLTGGAVGTVLAVLTGIAALVDIGLAIGAIAGAAVVLPLTERLDLNATR